MKKNIYPKNDPSKTPDTPLRGTGFWEVSRSVPLPLPAVPLGKTPDQHYLFKLSQCLAAALSEKLTGDTITESSQPNSQEALGELSELDNDFSMDLKLN